MHNIGSNRINQADAANGLDRVVNQGGANEAHPPGSNFLQRFCQKVDQLFTMRRFWRLVGVALIICGAVFGGPGLASILIPIIAGIMILNYSDQIEDETFFSCSKIVPPNEANS